MATKPGDWFCPSCGDHQFAKNFQCRQCGTPNPTGMMGMGGMMGKGGMMGMGGMMNPMMMGGKGGNFRPGDWMCPGCGDHVFASNSHCRKCHTPRPGSGLPKAKPGDWTCPNCKDFQFAKNASCRKCGTENPDAAGSLEAMQTAIANKPAVEAKPGDWYCPGCGELVFAKHPQCRQCQTPNPDPEGTKAALKEAGVSLGGKGDKGKAGDWNCPSCQDLQFARNMMCRRCGTPNPSSMMGMMMFGGGKKGGKGGKGATFGKGGAKSAAGGVIKAVQKPAAAGEGQTSWMCPNCNVIVFRRNNNCHACGIERP